MKRQFAACLFSSFLLLASCGNATPEPSFPDVAKGFSYSFSKNDNALAGKDDFAVTESFDAKQRDDFLKSIVIKERSRMDFQYHHRLKSPKREDWFYFKETGYMAANAAKTTMWGEFSFALGDKNAAATTISTLYALNGNEASYCEWDGEGTVLFKGNENIYRLAFSRGSLSETVKTWDFFGKNKDGNVVLSKRTYYPSKENAIYASENCFLFEPVEGGYVLATQCAYDYDMSTSLGVEWYLRTDYSDFTKEAPKTMPNVTEAKLSSHFQGRAKDDYALFPAITALKPLQKYFPGQGIKTITELLWSAPIANVSAIAGKVSGSAGNNSVVPLTAALDDSGNYWPAFVAALLFFLEKSLE